MQGGPAQGEERRQAVDEEPAGIDDARVQQGVDWRRSEQRARQPNMQRKLRRFPHRADEHK